MMYPPNNSYGYGNSEDDSHPEGDLPRGFSCIGNSNHFSIAFWRIAFPFLFRLFVYLTVLVNRSGLKQPYIGECVTLFLNFNHACIDLGVAFSLFYLEIGLHSSLFRYISAGVK